MAKHNLHYRTRRLLERQLRLAEKTCEEAETYDAELAEMVTNLARAVATFTAEERKREAHNKKMGEGADSAKRDETVRAFLSQLPRAQLKDYITYLSQLYESSEERI